MRTLRVSAEQPNDWIDLRAFQGDGIDFEKLFVEGDPHRPLTIIVPYGAKAEATATKHSVIAKSVVLYADAHGQVDLTQKPRRLQGSVSDRTTLSSGGRLNLDVQHAVRHVANNMKVGLVDGKPAATTYACRHFALWNLMARMKHHALPHPKPQFSIGPVLNENAIKNLDLAELERQWVLMERSGPSVVFDQTQIGQALHAAFEGIQPGERRYFGVHARSAPNGHLLSFELSAKRVPHGAVFRTEFALNLYDPNKTATHERLVVDDPSKLLQMDLSSWFDVMAVGELLPWPPLAEGLRHQPKFFVAPNSPLTPEFQNDAGVAFLAGSSMVGAYVNAYAGHIYAHEPNRGEAMRRLATFLMDGLSLTWVGLSRGKSHCPSVVSYVESVLALPPEHLSEAGKEAVIGRILTGGAGTLALLIDEGRPGAKHVLTAVLASPHLTSEVKTRLVWARIGGLQPALHKLCSTAMSEIATNGYGQADDAVRAKKHPAVHSYELVYDYVLAIANSNLDDSDKESLIQAAHLVEGSDDDSSDSDDEVSEDYVEQVESAVDAGGERHGTTAACEAHAQGNYGATAAFVTAIFDCNASTERKTAWLRQLGVPLGEVIASMSSAVHGPREHEWALATVEKLTSSRV